MQQIGISYGARMMRSRSVARARLSFNPTASRRGRVWTQCRRCLVAKNGLATTADVVAWAYPRGERRHWQFEVVREALAKLGARRIGRGAGRGRPLLWAISVP